MITWHGKGFSAPLNGYIQTRETNPQFVLLLFFMNKTSGQDRD